MQTPSGCSGSLNAQEGFLLIISNPVLTAWKKIFNIISDLTI